MTADIGFPLVVAGAVFVLASVLRALARARSESARANAAERRIEWHVHAAERERISRDFWQQRASDWRNELFRERQRYEALDAEHKELLKNLAPQYLVRPDAAIEADVDTTPSVAESDRLEVEERKRQAEREFALAAARSSGFEQAVVDDSDAPPPHRLDLAYDDDEDDGVPG